jgi:hypothetical protein
MHTCFRESVDRVLLADGWHQVFEGTFRFTTGGEWHDTSEESSAGAAQGFTFDELVEGEPKCTVTIYGPAASILALQEKPWPVPRRSTDSVPQGT